MLSETRLMLITALGECQYIVGRRTVAAMQVVFLAFPVHNTLLYFTLHARDTVYNVVLWHFRFTLLLFTEHKINAPFSLVQGRLGN